MNPANPKLPKESRAYLTDLSFRESIAEYTSDAYVTINRFLREGGALEPHDAAILADLRQAFSQAEPFAEPIKVFRALDLRQEEVAEFIQDLQQARNEGRIIMAQGFQSCTTNKRLAVLASTRIKFVIKARLGMDVRPVSVSPYEDELLLNHGSFFEVRKIRHPPGAQQIVVRMEQVLL